MFKDILALVKFVLKMLKNPTKKLGNLLARFINVPEISASTLGELPWETKLGTKVTSLALLTKN